MQNLQDIQEKIFFESKNILDTLSKINSKEELLSKQDLFAEVADRIAFLRILEKNKDIFEQEVQSVDNQDLNIDAGSSNINDYSENLPPTEDVIEEEVIFTNEINDIDGIINSENQEELAAEEVPGRGNTNDSDQISAETVKEESLQEVEGKDIPFLVEQEDPDYADRVSQKEKDFLESEERRRKIVEFNKEETPHSSSTEYFHEEKASSQHVTEKKFKLANIKGLKAVQNLFDEDPLEKIEEDQHEISSEKSDSGSLLKTNISTEFMEAHKKHPEFKLDLNDKVAFTKLLFNGDEVELKTTIEKLNSFENLEGARQYLSEIYYKKDWKNADEYAQRLWDLVESKF